MALWRWFRYLVLTLIVAALIYFGARGYRIYQQLQLVKADMSTLSGFSLSSIQPQDLQKVGLVLDKTKVDLANLQADVSPWLWLTNGLGWVPVYGGDLKYAGDLLETASEPDRCSAG